MSIRDYTKKIKGNIEGLKIGLEIVFSVILVLTCLASFGLGRLSVQKPAQNDTVSIIGQVSTYEDYSGSKQGGGYQESESSYGVYVASRSGTKYYLPSCSGASRIKEENKIWFNSTSEAESAGFTKSSTCNY